jgi:hypothetical protein
MIRRLNTRHRHRQNRRRPDHHLHRLDHHHRLCHHHRHHGHQRHEQGKKEKCRQIVKQQ